MIVVVDLDPTWLVSVVADRLSLGQESEVTRVRGRPGGSGVALAGLLASHGNPVRLVLPTLDGEQAAEFTAMIKGWGVDVQPLPAPALTLPVVVELSTPQARTTLREPRTLMSGHFAQQLAGAVEPLLRTAGLVTIHGGRSFARGVEGYAELVTLAREAGVPTLVQTDIDVTMAALRSRPTAVTASIQHLITVTQLFDLEGFEQPETALLTGGRAFTGSGTSVLTALRSHELGVMTPSCAWRALPVVKPRDTQRTPLEISPFQLMPIAQRLSQGPITDDEWPAVLATALAWGQVGTSGKEPTATFPDRGVQAERIA